MPSSREIEHSGTPRPLPAPLAQPRVRAASQGRVIASLVAPKRALTLSGASAGRNVRAARGV